MKELHIRVSGMKCEGCVESVRSALRDLDGVSRAEVFLEREEARVLGQDGLTLEELVAAVRGAGFEASPT